MLTRALFLASLSTLATPLPSQVPFEHFVVSTRSPGSGPSAWFVDPRTGDLTPVLGLVTPLTELAIVAEEPMSGALYLAEAIASTRAPSMHMVPMSGRSTGSPFRLTWTGPAAPMTDAVFGAGGNLFMVIGGTSTTAGLWNGLLIGGPAVQLGAVPDGVEIAADANAAYVLTHKTGVPSTIWRYDVGTSAFTQVIGGLPESKAFDLFPPGTTRLLVGSQSGDLWLADAATSQFTLHRPVGQGPIAVLRHSTAGATLFATDSGAIYSLASLAAPLAQLPRVPTDMDLGSMFAASFFTFGSGCAGSGNFVPAMGSTGLPALGNASFAFTASAGPGGAPAILAVGNSRKDWGGIPLPFDLSPLGAPGCAIAAKGILLVPMALTGSGPGAGTASFSLPIPNQTALAGVKLSAQWWILDPPANALGLIVSEGGDAIVR